MSKIHSYSLIVLFVVALIPVAFAEQTINDRIKIDSTTTTTLDNSYLDISNGDKFGIRIENIGDLDSNGVDDLVVYSAGDNSPTYDNVGVGSLAILFMNDDGTVYDTNKIFIDDTSDGIGNVCFDDFDNQYTPNDNGHLAYLGNLIDGNPTLALGFWSNNHDLGDGSIIDNSGAVYLLELNTDGKVNSCLRIIPGENGFNPDDAYYRPDGDADFGWPVIATDLNGDGQSELIVGATTNDKNNTNLWVLFLNSDGTVASHSEKPIRIIDDGTIQWFDSGDTIDGRTKIVVGAIDETENQTFDNGYIHIINLTTTGEFSSSTTHDGISLVGDETDDMFGSAVTPLGDVDGDKINDIMVGNYLGDDTNSDSGEVYILFLNSDDTVKSYQKISNLSEINGTTSDFLSTHDSFGLAITLWTYSANTFSDGTAVIAISASGDDTGGSNIGAIHLFYITITPQYTPTSIVSGGGCNDCVPPTIGITPNQNTVTISAWEEKGPYYIQLTELSLDTAKIQVWMGYWLYQDIPNVKEIKVIDPDGILESSDVVVSTIDCDKKIECLQVHFQYDLAKKVSDISITTSDFYKNSVTKLLD